MALALHPGRGPFSPSRYPVPARRVLPLLGLGLWAAGARPVVPAAAGREAAPPTGESAAVAGTLLADTLVVRAGRSLDATAPTAGSLVSRLDLEEGTGARDAADLLDTVAGLQVRRCGGIGASAVPSIRGSAAAQIRLFIDGMPLDDAQSGVVDLASLPLERFRSVDVHRGTVPAGLGGLAGAGALDFRTRDRDAGPEVKLFAGSFADRGGRLSWGAANADGSRSGLVAIHGRRSDNDYEFVDPVGTFHRTDDDTLAVRRNAWIREHGAWLTGALRGGPGRVRTSLGFFRRDGGRPGVLGRESPHASVRYDRIDGRVGVGVRDDLLLLDLAAGRSREWLYDPLFEVGLLRTAVTRSASEDRSGRLTFSPVLRNGTAGGPIGGVALQAGLERRAQTFDLRYDGDADPRRERTISAAFAQIEIGLPAARLLVAPSWRWSRHRDDFPPTVPIAMPWLPEEEGVAHVRDAVSPALGTVWTLVPERLFLESHVSRSERAPTWTELFGHRGGIEGNRDLLSEEIAAFDLALGVRSPDGAFSARSALFQVSTDRTIVYIQASPGTSRAVNGGASRTAGVELEAACRLPADWRLQGNCTLQQARDRSGLPEYDGKDLPYLPDRQAWLRLDGPAGRWRPRLEVAALGSNFRDRYNTGLNRPPARVTVNLGLSRAWAARRLTAELEVMNVTNDRIFDLEGFPLPGRSVHLALRYGT